VWAHPRQADRTRSVILPAERIALRPASNRTAIEKAQWIWLMWRGSKTACPRSKNGCRHRMLGCLRQRNRQRARATYRTWAETRVCRLSTGVETQAVKFFSSGCLFIRDLPRRRRARPAPSVLGKDRQWMQVIGRIRRRESRLPWRLPSLPDHRRYISTYGHHRPNHPGWFLDYWSTCWSGPELCGRSGNSP